MTVNKYTTYPTSVRLDAIFDRSMPRATARLRAAGWTFGLSDDVRPGSAVTNPYTKQIVCRRRVADGGRRDRLYVVFHERGHALDFLAGLPSAELGKVLAIAPASAQEALAEAVALWGARDTGEGRLWVRASIMWHCLSPRWRYTSRHVRHPATRELADMLVRGPGHGGGTSWRWNVGQIVPA